MSTLKLFGSAYIGILLGVFGLRCLMGSLTHKPDSRQVVTMPLMVHSGGVIAVDGAITVLGAYLLVLFAIQLYKDGKAEYEYDHKILQCLLNGERVLLGKMSRRINPNGWDSLNYLPKHAKELGMTYHELHKKLREMFVVSPTTVSQ
jgi:hypothetical protein